MSGSVIGLDIGSGGVRAVEVRNGHTARPVVVRSHSLPLPAGSVERGEVLDIRAVSEVVGQLWSSGRFRQKEVVMGMGGTAVMSRELSVPRGPMARIRESLPFLVENVLPVPVADTILAFYPVSEGQGDDGPVVHGLLVAAIKDAVSANVAAVTQAGLTPLRVDLVPFALTRAIAPRRSATDTIAIVSVGASVTNVVIVDRGIPQFVRILPSGGDDLALVPAKSGWGFDVAELLAMDPSSPLPAPPAPLAEGGMREKMDDLVAGIRATVDYYLNSRSGANVDRVVLTGGGSRVGRLDVALADSLEVDVERASEFPGARLAKTVQGGPPEERASMTTAYGLALGARR